MFAAPAIVQASSLMPVRGVPLYGRNNLLTIDMITREAVELFANSNAFLKNLTPYEDAFASPAPRLDVLYGSMKVRPEWSLNIGDKMPVRLPNDYVVTGVEMQNSFRVDRNPYHYDKARRTLVPNLPELSVPAALALGAAAVVAKNPVVSRRFWGNR